MTKNKTRMKRGKRKNHFDEEIKGFRNSKKDKKVSKKINLTDLYNDETPFDSDESFHNMGHLEE